MDSIKQPRRLQTERQTPKFREQPGVVELVILKWQDVLTVELIRKERG
jgi:hypothetical protein